MLNGRADLSGVLVEPTSVAYWQSRPQWRIGRADLSGVLVEPTSVAYW